MAQTLAQPIDLEGTDELFMDDLTLDAQGDEEAILHDDQVKFVEDETWPFEEDKTVYKGKDEEILVDQP